MSSITAWRECFDLHNGPEFAHESDYFSIRYYKVTIDSGGARKEKNLGSIDFCHIYYLSRLEIIGMGKALGLVEDECKYYWKLPFTGEKFRVLDTDKDVTYMAQSVPPCRWVIVEAVLTIPEPVAAPEEKKDVLWRCARAIYEARYKEEMNVMGSMLKEAHDYLAGIDPSHWTRSQLSEKFKCDMLLNNLCECFNSFILDARTKGFITMNEIIRTSLMKRIQKREC